MIYRYGSYTIQPSGLPQPAAWSFQHDDYDGAPTHSLDTFSPDNRCGAGTSPSDCVNQIVDIELWDIEQRPALVEAA